MEIVMKNDTCSLHIEGVGKGKLKGHGFGFLEKGTHYTQVSVFQLLEISQHMLWIWVGRQSCMQNYTVISKLEINCDLFIFSFVVKRCDINF